MKLKCRIILAVAFCLALSSVGQALSLSEIRTQVRVRLRDSAADTSFQRFSDSTLNGFINTSQRDFVSQTLLLSGTTVLNLTVATAEYDLPSDYLSSIRVTISSITLEQVSIAGLDADGLNWTTATSTPTKYYVTPHSSAVNYMIGFHPKPHLTSVGTVKMFYYQQASDLVSDTDVPFGGKLQYVPYHLAIVDYATAIGWLIQGRLDLAKPFLDLYSSQIGNAKRNLGFMPDFNPAATSTRGPGK